MDIGFKRGATDPKTGRTVLAEMVFRHEQSASRIGIQGVFIAEGSWAISGDMVAKVSSRLNASQKKEGIC